MAVARFQLAQALCGEAVTEPATETMTRGARSAATVTGYALSTIRVFTHPHSGSSRLLCTTRDGWQVYKPTGLLTPPLPPLALPPAAIAKQPG